MTQSGHCGQYVASLRSGFLRDNFRKGWSLGDINAPTSSNGIAFRAIFRCGDICTRCVSAVARTDELRVWLWVSRRVLGCLPIRGHAAGLDCPVLGPGSVGSVPNLLTDLQIKLIAPGDSADLANEINDLVNKLQILKPNISYAELTNIVIAAFCPVVASANLTASEKWDRMRQFDTILQRQLAANMLAPGTLIVANVPLPPAVYRELRSQAAKVSQTPSQFMAAILTRAAGN